MIFIISIEKKWKGLLRNIFLYGSVNKKDDSKVKEVLGYHTFIENPFNDFIIPINSDRLIELLDKDSIIIDGYPMKPSSIAEYLKGMHNEDIFKCFEKEDGFVYTYPERLLAMRSWNKDTKDKDIINQLDVIINRLKNNSGSNRAVATIYNCGLDKDEVDIPCLQFIQATIRDNKLMLHVIFRSNDIFGAWPANMFFITYLGLLICDKLQDVYPSLSFKGIDYHVTSAHYYMTDEDMVKEVL